MNPHAPTAQAVWHHSRAHRVVVPTRSPDYDDRNAGWWDLYYKSTVASRLLGLGGPVRRVLLAHADIHHGSLEVMAYVNNEWVNLDTIATDLVGAVAVTS